MFAPPPVKAAITGVPLEQVLAEAAVEAEAARESARKLHHQWHHHTHHHHHHRHHEEAEEFSAKDDSVQQWKGKRERNTINPALSKLPHCPAMCTALTMVTLRTSLFSLVFFALRMISTLKNQAQVDIIRRKPRCNKLLHAERINR